MRKYCTCFRWDKCRSLCFRNFIKMTYDGTVSHNICRGIISFLLQGWSYFSGKNNNKINRDFISLNYRIIYSLPVLVFYWSCWYDRPLSFWNLIRSFGKRESTLHPIPPELQGVTKSFLKPQAILVSIEYCSFCLCIGNSTLFC